MLLSDAHDDKIKHNNISPFSNLQFNHKTFAPKSQCFFEMFLILIFKTKIISSHLGNAIGIKISLQRTPSLTKGKV